MSDEVLSLVLSYGCECLLQQSSDFIFQALVSYEVVFLLMISLRIYYDWWHLKMETLPRWTFLVLLVRLNISEYVKWKWNHSSGYFDFMGSKFHLRSIIYKLGITFPFIFSQIYVVPVTTYFSYISYIITRKGLGLLLATNA